MADIDKELFLHCKAIAQELESIADNGFYEKSEDDNDDERFFFDETYNTDYVWRVGQGIIGVRIMVACGGPNIWVDTTERCVHGYWGGSDEACYLTPETCDAINDLFRSFAYDDIRNEIDSI